MIDVILAIAAFIVTIGILVSFHEYGHFAVARALGFKVLRFSVGFGKPLCRWQGRPPSGAVVAGTPAPAPTEYWISSIPLGGYVKLLDEREGPVPAAERHMAFNRRPIPQRIAVLAAGPGFNFVFAIMAYWLMFVTGVPSLKAFVGDVTPGSTAARAGLAEYDEILAVGDRPTPTWEAATLAILDELLRDGRIDMTVEGADGR
ncbi:MAG: RIP metalloprotease RseP, partial [Rhodospirillaceae bacterium]|nr:RIP metalloprotease RseP [Rhodospirillaceae bacterium]